jgi:hypothetical protein
VFTPSILDLVTGGESEQAPEGASFDVQEFFDPKQDVDRELVNSVAKFVLDHTSGISVA